MSAKPQWLTLPVTPTLPKAARSGYAPINGIRIWYALFGQGDPVLLLHGGLANSDYWGNQVPVLARHYQVIVMDSRGHGRSTRDQHAFSHRLMTSDVIGLMDFLKIWKAAIVGWSDGADIGLDMAINFPDRLTKLFAFASDTDPSGLNDLTQSDVFNAYIARTRLEYEKLSPTPSEYDAFLNQINKMWMSRPILTAEQLGSIRVPVWVVDADHEEAVKRENTLAGAKYQEGTIPNCTAARSPVRHLTKTARNGLLQQNLPKTDTCTAANNHLFDYLISSTEQGVWERNA